MESTKPIPSFTCTYDCFQPHDACTNASAIVQETAIELALRFSGAAAQDLSPPLCSAVGAARRTGQHQGRGTTPSEGRRDQLLNRAVHQWQNSPLN